MKTLDRFFLPLLLLLVFLLHASLSGEGALSLGDERRYLNVLAEVERWWEGQTSLALIFADLPALSHGRPIAGAYYFLLGLLHRKFLWSEDPFHPSVLAVLQLLQGLTHIASIGGFFVLARSAGLTKYPARIATLLFAILPSGLLFARHLLPYHLALTFHFLSLALLLRDGPRESRNRGLLASGVLAALGFLTYPGFYFHLSIYLLVLVYRARSLSDSWRDAASFLGAFIVPLILFEAAGGGVRGAFSDQLHALSHTVTQGSFAESGVFPFKYLLMAEGLVGVVVLLLLPINLVSYSSNQRSLRAAGCLLAGALAALSFHAAAGVVFEKMVFYGRLMMGVVPHLLLFTVAVMESASHRRVRLAVLTGLALLSLASAIRALSVIAYPRDVLYALPGDIERTAVRVSTIDACEEVHRGRMPLVPHEPGQIETEAWILQNFCAFYPVLGPSGINVPDRPAAYMAWHFLTYTPYLFETFTPEERDVVQQQLPIVAVYPPGE